jgi:hypothetical protein
MLSNGVMEKLTERHYCDQCGIEIHCESCGHVHVEEKTPREPIDWTGIARKTLRVPFDAIKYLGIGVGWILYFLAMFIVAVWIGAYYVLSSPILLFYAIWWLVNFVYEKDTSAPKLWLKESLTFRCYCNPKTDETAVPLTILFAFCFYVILFIIYTLIFKVF